MAEIVIVGAGVGGLAAAIRLAAAGHRVSVCERGPAAGGKLGEVVHRHHVDGGDLDFSFDTGAHLLTLPQVFADLFEVSGSTLDSELSLEPLDPLTRHVFADGTVFDSSADLVRLRDNVATAFGEQSARQWQQVWRRAERCFTTSWRHVLTAPIRSPRQLAGLAWRLSDLRAIGPGRSLYGVSRSHLDDPRLRTLVQRYATYAGADPRRAPAALLAIVYAEMAFGGFTIRGGMRRLVDALERRCQELGVTIRIATEVGNIDHDGVRVRGVRLTDGTRLPADAIVANVDSTEILALIDGPAGARFAAARRPAHERSLSGFVLLLGIRGRTPGLARHSVFFPERYLAEFDAIFGHPARLADDPTIFVSVADDPVATAAGFESWFVLVNAPPLSATCSYPPEIVESYAGRVLDRLAARGLDVRDRVLFRIVRTPADLAASAGPADGAIYGPASHGLTGLLRPPNQGPLRGLYFVGGGAHPGGGLPMVATSAAIVASLIGPA